MAPAGRAAHGTLAGCAFAAKLFRVMVFRTARAGGGGFPEVRSTVVVDCGTKPIVANHSSDLTLTAHSVGNKSIRSLSQVNCSEKLA